MAITSSSSRLIRTSRRALSYDGELYAHKYSEVALDTFGPDRASQLWFEGSSLHPPTCHPRPRSHQSSITWPKPQPKSRSSPYHVRYDANGNRLTTEEPSGDVTTNTWDPENRLVKVEHDDGTEVEYKYNGDGLRVEKVVDGTDTTKFIFDGNNVLQETDDVGTVEAEFTYLPGQYGRVISQHRDTDSSFYHFDGIKNVRQLTDDAEVVSDEYAFDAFGKETSASGSTANSQRYKGRYLAYHQAPEAAPQPQYLLHHRNYDPSTGIFTSRDPAEDDSNLYRYVKNNPINREDPSGLQDEDEDAISVRDVELDDEQTRALYAANQLIEVSLRIQELRKSIASNERIAKKRHLRNRGRKERALKELRYQRVQLKALLSDQELFADKLTSEFAEVEVPRFYIGPGFNKEYHGGGTGGEAILNLALFLLENPDIELGGDEDRSAVHGIRPSPSPLDFLAGGFAAGLREILRRASIRAVARATATATLEEAAGLPIVNPRKILTSKGTAIIDDALANQMRIANTAQQLRNATRKVRLIASESQLQSKFKHAHRFGVTGHQNKANLAKFSEALQLHIDSVNTKSFTGTYRGDPVVHYVDPATGLHVMTDLQGNFLSGWKLNPDQLWNVLNRGSL